MKMGNQPDQNKAWSCLRLARTKLDKLFCCCTGTTILQKRSDYETLEEVGVNTKLPEGRKTLHQKPENVLFVERVDIPNSTQYGDCLNNDKLTPGACKESTVFARSVIEVSNIASDQDVSNSSESRIQENEFQSKYSHNSEKLNLSVFRTQRALNDIETCVSTDSFVANNNVSNYDNTIPESNSFTTSNEVSNIASETCLLNATSGSMCLNMRESFDTKQYLAIAGICASQGPQSIDLCILVKTSMNSNYCYLGFDRQRKRIYRPIYRTTEEQCCWEDNLVVNRTYTFKALRFPNDNKPPFTMLPHNNDDLLVERNVKRKRGRKREESVFYELELIAKDSIEAIFNGIQWSRYIFENENSPSVGVLRCHGSQLLVFLFQNKIRIRIGSFDLPYTGLDADDQKSPPVVDPKYTALVVLGLSRPWKGKYNEYFQRRCAILVLRIIQPTE